MATITKQALKSVEGMSSREAAKKLGVGKSTINDARKAHDMGHTPALSGPASTKKKSSVTSDKNNSLIVEVSDEVPQTRDDVNAAMLAKGFDPEIYNFTYRFSEWESTRDGETITLYAARAGATLKPSAMKDDRLLNVDELIEAVANWTPPVIHVNTGARNESDALLAFADGQLGKSDYNGGSADTVNQMMMSFEKTYEFIKEFKPVELIWADLGDGLENFNNTSSQRETNDLDLTSQVRLLRRVQLEGIKRLREAAPIVHISVPSNHSQVRTGMQQQAGHASNDWGLEVSYQLEDVFATAGVSDVRFIRPAMKQHQSVGYQGPSETKWGFLHGDQAGSQNRLTDWWKGQALGRGPVSDADIICVGHFHNMGVVEPVAGRWIMTCAASDRGSAWFTEKTGQSASSGMTFFTTSHGMWDNLRIH